MVMGTFSESKNCINITPSSLILVKAFIYNIQDIYVPVFELMDRTGLSARVFSRVFLNSDNVD